MRSSAALSTLTINGSMLLWTAETIPAPLMSAEKPTSIGLGFKVLSACGADMQSRCLQDFHSGISTLPKQNPCRVIFPYYYNEMLNFAPRCRPLPRRFLFSTFRLFPSPAHILLYNASVDVCALRRQTPCKVPPRPFIASPGSQTKANHGVLLPIQGICAQLFSFLEFL